MKLIDIGQVDVGDRMIDQLVRIAKGRISGYMAPRGSGTLR